MPKVQIEAQLSTDKLLEAADQLSLPELERFAAQVLVLQARRKAPYLSKDEAALLSEINQGLPEAIRARYQKLLAKRDAETLSDDEYQELLRLTDEVESLHAKRMSALVKLAQLRGETLRSLMKLLDIPDLV